MAITRIESKMKAFYIVDKATGKRAYIGVVREPGRAPYLRTFADGKWNDNLLAQSECGADCKLIDGVNAPTHGLRLSKAEAHASLFGF